MPGSRRAVGEPALAQEFLQVSYVPDAQVSEVWYSQIDMIERAMTKGQADWATSEGMLESIRSGRSQLWAIHEGRHIVAIAVISVSSTKTMTKLFVRLLAGRRMPDWADMLVENLQRMKEMVGADCIEASCRPGLAKFLQKIGWSKKAVIVELK